jgi:hypothetical protein
MIRQLIFSLLLAAFLGQGWAQASMIGMVAPEMQDDCTGHVTSDASGDCCPDGADTAGACAAVCSAAVALAYAAPAVAISLEPTRSNFVQPVRAGPRYLPLNPPPIA